MPTCLNPSNFHSNAYAFIELILNELKSHQVQLTHLNIDHICYRVESLAEYDQMKTNLESIGARLTETMVNGRPITTYRLHKPIQFQNLEIHVVELPSPKLGTNYSTGFEHVEIVVKESLEVFSKKNSHLKFKCGGHKNTNPELSLQTSVGQIKFHNHSLERVIEIESANVTDYIFDFDGTLINSSEHIFEINSLVFSKALGRTVTVEEAKEKFYPCFKKLFELFEVTCPVAKAQAVESWSEISGQFSYQLFDGTLEVLSFLKDQNKKIHLWTARDEKSASLILNRLKLTSYFNTFSFAHEKKSKPCVESLNFDYLNKPKDSILMIGDSLPDVLGAKNISSIVAAALWDPHAKTDQLIANGAELLFYNTNELYQWIKNKAF